MSTRAIAIVCAAACGALFFTSPSALAADGGAAPPIADAGLPVTPAVQQAPAPAVRRDGGSGLSAFMGGVSAARDKLLRKPSLMRRKPAGPDGGVAANAAAPVQKGERQKGRKAIKALESVLDQEEKTLRRIGRVEEHLRRGDTSGAMKELERARRATARARETVQSFEEQEVLETSDYIIRGASTLGIGVLSILLALVLALLLRRVLSRATPEGAREMTTGVRWSYRFIVLLLTAGALSFGAWISIRLIWRLRVSSARVIEVLEHPLFAFEGRPVTFLSILFFLLTVAMLFIVSRHIRSSLERRVMPRFSADIGVQHAFSAILHYLILFVGLLISLEVLGVGASTVAIVAGVVGIGVGFGMQHLVNNFLSGIVLFFERPIRVGDWVDVAGTEGKVVRIHWRATTLLTRDNVTIVIPNSDFVQGKVLNLTIPDNRLRARVKVGVAYDTDLELLDRVLLEVGAGHPMVLKEPEPRVRILEFADSGLTVEFLYWLGDLQGKDQVASDIRFAIARTFRKHGVVIPFPRRDTRILSVDVERAPPPSNLESSL